MIAAMLLIPFCLLNSLSLTFALTLIFARFTHRVKVNQQEGFSLYNLTYFM